MKHDIVQNVIVVRRDIREISLNRINKSQSTLSKNMFSCGVSNLLFANHCALGMWWAESLELGFELFLENTCIACGSYEPEERR